MPRVTAESKDSKLKLAMIGKGAELLGEFRDKIPEGGHFHVTMWPDHISVLMSDGKQDVVFGCWASGDFTEVYE